MREVLFRGKTKKYDRYIKKGSWAYGDYVNLKDGDSILPHIYGFGEVCRDTVGQYIGIDDKNGKKVFEGDVVTFFHEGRYVQALVHYDSDLLSFVCESEFFLYTFSDVLYLYDNGMSDKFEIIGNIYDSPDLIGGFTTIMNKG